MYWRVSKESDCGKRFAAVQEKMAATKAHCDDVLRSKGVRLYHIGARCVAGGFFGAHTFDAAPDLNLWVQKKLHNTLMWLPNSKSKEGRSLARELDRLPQVSYAEFNRCVLDSGQMLSKKADFYVRHNRIGYALQHEEYIGFTTADYWDWPIHEACERISKEAYKSLFEPEPAAVPEPEPAEAVEP